MQTLLIDDDPTIAFFTERLFQRAGLQDQLTSFQSPTEAVAFLTEQMSTGLPPQVILLDLNMPLMSGWDVLDVLQPLEAQLAGHCSVYILTSSLAPSDAARSRQYPLVVRLLHKPLDQNELLAIQAQVAGRIEV
jgi:CheY-like chemotaxis protein